MRQFIGRCGLFVSFLFTIYAVGASAPVTNHFNIYVGAAEVVHGPDSRSDNPFHTLTFDDHMLAYIGNGNTDGYVGGSLETLRQLPAPVVEAGGVGQFDECGAWLNSAWRDGHVVRGWYHAETNCNYPATDKSVAYVQSSDNGRTYTKVNYPNNQLLTTPTHYTTDDADDEGDQHVIQVGNYLYMYFIASRDYQVRLARSPVAAGGVPGSWQKYYNGSFSEPALGGESTPLDPSGHLSRSWVSYSRPLNQYVGLSYIPTNTGAFGGFGLTFSADGVSRWSSIDHPLITNERTDYWDPQSQGELIEYPSMIGVYGDSETIDSVFWLYYMYLESGADFSQRYLLRRKVWIQTTNASDPTVHTPKTALNHYQSGNDDWFTTTNVGSNYNDNGMLGYLFTAEIPNSVPVYDCYIPFWDDHMLVPGDASCDGNPNLRRVGWISTVPFANSIAVYRCWDENATNHFISADPACAGAETEWRLGYLASGQSLPKNDYIALSNYHNSTVIDSWSTTKLPPVEYAFEQRLGYLFTQPPSHPVPVYDCYILFWDDHMLVVHDETCAGGDVQVLGLMGYLSSEPFAGGVAIYRCFDHETQNHFMTLDSACEGHELEWLAGYIATEPVSNTPTNIYLPTIRAAEPLSPLAILTTSLLIMGTVWLAR